MAANRIYIQVDFQSQSANQAISTLNQNISGIGKTAQSSSNQANSALRSVSVTVDEMGRSMRNALAAIGTLSFAAIAKDALDAALSFERNRLALNALTGSAAKGLALFQDLQKLAQTSAFEFKDLLEGAKRMVALGFAADEVVEKLRVMGLQVQAVGGDTGKLNDLINAFGQIRAAGHLTGEELRQLRNIPIPAESILSEKFGPALKQRGISLKKAIEEGLIPADQAIRAFTESIKKSGAALEKELGGSTTVALSNFQDAWHQFADEVISKYLPALTDFINNQLIPALKELSKWWTENSAAIETTAKVVAGLVVGQWFYKLGVQI